MRLSVKPAVLATALKVNGATTATPLTTTYGATGDSESILVQGHKWACYSIFVDVLALPSGGSPQLDVLVQEGPDGTNWAPLQTEAVTSGVATLSDYVQQKAIPGTGLLYTVHAPVRGGLYQRLRLKFNLALPDIAAVRVQYSLSGGPV